MTRFILFMAVFFSFQSAHAFAGEMPSIGQLIYELLPDLSKEEPPPPKEKFADPDSPCRVAIRSAKDERETREYLESIRGQPDKGEEYHQKTNFADALKRQAEQSAVECERNQQNPG